MNTAIISDFTVTSVQINLYEYNDKVCLSYATKPATGCGFTVNLFQINSYEYDKVCSPYAVKIPKYKELFSLILSTKVICSSLRTINCSI